MDGAHQIGLHDPQGRSPVIHAPRPPGVALGCAAAFLVTICFVVPGILMELFFFGYLGGQPATRFPFVAHVLGFSCILGSMLVLPGGIAGFFRRDVFYTDPDHLYRRSQWLFITRTQSWPRLNICTVFTRLSAFQASWSSTGFGGKTKSGSTKYQDLALALDDGRIITLAAAESQKEITQTHQALFDLLGRNPPPRASWGLPAGNATLVIDDKPDMLKITLHPINPRTLGLQYWLGIIMMVFPFVFALALVPDLMGYSDLFDNHLSRGDTAFKVLGSFIFAGAFFTFFAGGAFLFSWTKKHATTSHVITLDSSHLAAVSSYRGESETRKFAVDQVLEIRRESYQSDGQEKLSDTLQAVFQTGAPKLLADLSCRPSDELITVLSLLNQRLTQIR